MVSSLISESCKNEGLVSLYGSLEENLSGLWVVEIVEEVGLITCERRVIGQRARLLIGRSAQGILLRQHPHGRGKGRSQSSGGWSGRWERQMKSAKWGSKRDQTLTQAHDTWMGWRAQTLEPKSCETSLWVRTNTRKRWRVRCTVYTTRAPRCGGQAWKEPFEWLLSKFVKSFGCRLSMLWPFTLKMWFIQLTPEDFRGEGQILSMGPDTAERVREWPGWHLLLPGVGLRCSAVVPPRHRVWCCRAPPCRRWPGCGLRWFSNQREYVPDLRCSRWLLFFCRCLSAPILALAVSAGFRRKKQHWMRDVSVIVVSEVCWASVFLAVHACSGSSAPMSFSNTTFSLNWPMPYQGGCSQVLISSRGFDSSICDWKNKFSLFGKYHFFRIKSFRVDFRCVHRLQLLNVCNYVTLLNFTRVQCVFEE